jgi:hypothetical protein
MSRNVEINEIGVMDTDRRTFVRCWIDKERRCNPECAAFSLEPLMHDGEEDDKTDEHFTDVAVMCWKDEIGIMLEQPSACAPREEHEQPAPEPASDLEP